MSTDYKTIAANRNTRERDYWLQQLAGDLPRSFFPYDYRNSGEYRPGTAELQFSGTTYENLMKLSTGSDYTLHIILTTVLNLLLHRYARQQDIVTGTPIYRQKTEGQFINTVLPIRSSINGTSTFKEFLIRTKQTIIDAVEHQNYPIEAILYNLCLEFSTEDFPLFDVALLVENIQDAAYIEPIRPGVIFRFRRGPDGITGTIDYDNRRYEGHTAKRILEHFGHLLEEAVRDIDAPIANISFLPEDEKKQILEQFNGNRAQYDLQQTLHQRFEQRAHRHPREIAAVYGRASITYEQLNRRANRLARLLIEEGVTAGVPVGIMMDRSITMMESILATWKAGGAYIPIDPGYPARRVISILNDSRAPVLLTLSAHARTAVQAEYKGKILAMDTPREELAEFDSSNPDLPVKMENTAYIIYTSGSTGTPKGVIVEHLGMMNHICAKIDTLELDQTAVIAQNASPTFDISIWQMWTAPVLGGRTVIYSEDLLPEPNRWAEALAEDRITVLEVVPSYLALLLDLVPSLHRYFEKLRCLVVTGETLKPALVTRWFEAVPNVPMVNAYGPTEASDDITQFHITEDPGFQRVPIGKPLPNFDIFIVDEQMNLCPIGVKGEICVTGTGVGRGYFNRPQLTREKFIDSRHVPFLSLRPQAALPAGRSTLYRTGDLGCFLPDGNIAFFGRIDHQVKIRGFRIELEEIASAMTAYENVREAVALAREDSPGSPYLCAYFVPVNQNEPDIAGLKIHMEERLPDYMVPAFFITMERFPLTTAGKIDRKALPQPDTGDIGQSVYVAPRDDIEKRLTQLWKEVLRVDKVGIEDSFFELGGNSLSTTVLIARLHKEFNVKISLAEIFQLTSVRKIADYIKQRTPETYVPVEPAKEQPYYPLSPAQEGLYVMQQADPENTGFNEPIFLQVEGEVEELLLEAALQQILERHESPRTSFHIENGKPVQKIHDHCEIEIDMLESHEDGVEQVIADFIRPFDLSRAPLLRVALIETGPNRYILVIDMPHIVSDGVSHTLLLEDFVALYQGEELPLPSLQYKDYATWQHRQWQSGAMDPQEAFWVEQFTTNPPLLHLPLDFDRPRIRSFEGDSVMRQISPELSEALKQLAAQENATLYMVMLSIYSILLGKLAGVEDIVVGTAVAGRRHQDLQKVFGLFINTLPLKLTVPGHLSFKNYLAQIKAATLEAFDNQDYPFDKLVDKVIAERDPARHPLFDVMFQLQHAAVTRREVDGLIFTPYQRRTVTSKLDLLLDVLDMDNRLLLKLEFSTRLFKRETIGNFLSYYEKIARAVTESRDIALRDIQLLDDAARDSIIEKINHEEVDIGFDI